MKEEDIFQYMMNAKEGLPPRQRRVCDYILDNYPRIAFLTAEELAKETGTSPATVHRMAINLGFKSYKALKDKLRERASSSYALPLNKIRDALGAFKENEIVREVINENIKALKDVMNEQLLGSFPKAIERLSEARRIYIIGLRSTRGIALYLHALLLQITPDVFLVDYGGTDMMFEVMIDMNAHDALIALMAGVPRYTKRTIYAVEYAHGKGTPIILITNTLSNVVAPLATEILLAPQRTKHYSAIPLLAVCDALVAALGSRKKKEAYQRIDSLSQLLVKYDISE
ncbi:MAG: MurR/RpiR family transcriptional regulator [Synergistetes bacterium]|nr:MurR/RpiR family transcriptional regulator [Synergistota bacterium]